MNQRFSGEMLDLQAETKICFPKIFHLKFVFQIFFHSYELFKIPNKILIINIQNNNRNLVSNFLIKIHRSTRLFTYPSISKYSLRRLYDMRANYFNLYRDRCNLIEHILWGFILFASTNLNPLGIFMYMSSMDPYK